MIELTTNFFCLTRTQRTQGGGRPLGRDYYSRRGEAGAASRQDSLWSAVAAAGASSHARPRAPRLQSSVHATTGHSRGLYPPRA